MDPSQTPLIRHFLHTRNLAALDALAKGISNSVLEAMACGIQTIATNVGGNPMPVPTGMEKLIALCV